MAGFLNCYFSLRSPSINSSPTNPFLSFFSSSGVLSPLSKKTRFSGIHWFLDFHSPFSLSFSSFSIPSLLLLVLLTGLFPLIMFWVLQQFISIWSDFHANQTRYLICAYMHWQTMYRCDPGLVFFFFFLDVFCLGIQNQMMGFLGFGFCRKSFEFDRALLLSKKKRENRGRRRRRRRGTWPSLQRLELRSGSSLSRTGPFFPACRITWFRHPGQVPAPWKAFSWGPNFRIAAVGRSSLSVLWGIRSSKKLLIRLHISWSKSYFDDKRSFLDS